MGKDKEIKIDKKDLQYSYNRTLDIFKLLNDNYFKRVQIIMISLQVGIFYALLKILIEFDFNFSSHKTIIILEVVAFIGGFLSFIWNKLNKKQMQYLELLKRYLRNLELELASKKVPLDYFNIESALSKHINNEKIETIKTKIIGKEIRPEKGRHVYFKCSEDRYPDEEDSGKMLNRIKKNIARLVESEGKGKDIYTVGRGIGGLAPCESYLGKGIFGFWLILAVALPLLNKI